jgi:CheY-like chemotaxis protein
VSTRDGVILRLLVVDDHPVVRAGLVAMLGEEPDFEVVGEAADGTEAVTRVAELGPETAPTPRPGSGSVAAPPCWC